MVSLLSKLVKQIVDQRIGLEFGQGSEHLLVTQWIDSRDGVWKGEPGLNEFSIRISPLLCDEFVFHPITSVSLSVCVTEMKFISLVVCVLGVCVQHTHVCTSLFFHQ